MNQVQNDSVTGLLWSVNLTEEDTRQMTGSEVALAYLHGDLTNDETFVWREGMGDWISLGSCSELQQVIARYQGQSAPAPAPAFQAAPSFAAAPAFATHSQPPPAAAPAPARSKSVPAPPRQPSAGGGGGAFSGSRNEESSLFSIDMINNATKPRGPAPRQEARIEGLMNFGTGGIAGQAAALSAPPLNAPVPPRPKPKPKPAPAPMPAPQISHAHPSAQSHPAQSHPSAPQYSSPAPGQSIPGQSIPGQSMPGQSIPGQSIPGQSIPGQSMPGQAPPAAIQAQGHHHSMPAPGAASIPPTAAPWSMSAPTATPNRKPMLFALAGGAALLLLLVVGGVVMMGSGGQAAKLASLNAAEQPIKEANDQYDAVEHELAEAEAEKEAAAKKAKEDEDKKDGDDEPNADATDPKAVAAAAAKRPVGTTTEPKPKKKAPPFNIGAAKGAMGGAAGAASGCRGKSKKGSPGKGRATVSFSPSGRAVSVSISGVSGSVASCARGIFRGARVPAFSGATTTVSKSFRVR